MAFFHYYLLIFALCTLYVQSADPNPIAQLCNENSDTVTPHVTKLMDEVLTNVVKNTPQTGFNVSTAEKEEEETVLEFTALAQCRADVPSQECTTCLQKAAKEIKKMCPNRVDARIWYEYCHLRYDISGYFIGSQDTDFRVVHYNVEHVSNPKAFRKALNELTEQMKKTALKPDSKEFGKGEIKLSDTETLYGMMQCTRDFGMCDMNLEYAQARFANLCEDKKGCRVIYDMGYTRYELYPILYPH